MSGKKVIIGEGTYRRVIGAVSRVEKMPVNLMPPARSQRSSVPPSTSLGIMVFVRISGLHPFSPTSGVRMYRGHVYGNGLGADPTGEEVPISIPGIAADVTAPSYGQWGDLPPCAAIGYTTTWPGRLGSRTEVVYYTAGDMLLR